MCVLILLHGWKLKNPPAETRSKEVRKLKALEPPLFPAPWIDEYGYSFQNVRQIKLEEKKKKRKRLSLCHPLIFNLIMKLSELVSGILNVGYVPVIGFIPNKTVSLLVLHNSSIHFNWNRIAEQLNKTQMVIDTSFHSCGPLYPLHLLNMLSNTLCQILIPSRITKLF